MAEKICKKCGKVYTVADVDSDNDYCSFDCWESVNCLEPPKAPFEDLVSDFLMNRVQFE